MLNALHLVIQPNLTATYEVSTIMSPFYVPRELTSVPGI